MAAASSAVQTVDPTTAGDAALALDAPGVGSVAPPVSFTFQTESTADAALSVVRWTGTETLSELYEFEIEVAGDGAELPARMPLEQRATLAIRHGTVVRYIQGIVARVQHLTGWSQTQHTAFTVVPELWLLDQNQRCRIYQEMTTPEIVEKVLGNAGVYRKRSEWRLASPGAYQRRTYCVQYRETDLAFIKRLLEDEGIFFFFEHPADGPEKLVFCDNVAALDPIDEPSRVPYVEMTGRVHSAEHISRLELVAEARPGLTALRDYDPMQPRQNLETNANASENPREIYDYPGGYTQRGEGRRRSQVRLEALRTTTVHANGEGMVTRLIPGRTFDLSGHPRDGLDGGYVLWSVNHRALALEYTAHEGGRDGSGQGDSRNKRYEASFVCTPKDIPVRPHLRTHKPTVQGSQTATVVGPAGEEIYVDEHGRIKVQFHWDRDGQLNEHSSCWIRVQQSWASGGWGHLFIPRIGMEVVVTFLEGDPDRPLITGCVYNGANPPPNGLPAEKTKSTWKTNSSPGGAGYNELTFEDAAGNEKVFLRAQKDLEELVLNDHSTTVMHDQSNHVVHDQTENVDHDQRMTVGNDRTKTVGKNETMTIGVNQTQSIGANQTEQIGANQTLTVGANQATTVGANRMHTTGANQMETIGGNEVRAIGGNVAETIKGSHAETVGGAHIQNNKKIHMVKTGGGHNAMISKFDNTIVKGPSNKTSIGPMALNSLLAIDARVIQSAVQIKPRDISVSAPKGITLKVGDAVIKLEPDKITVAFKSSTIVLDEKGVSVTADQIQNTAAKDALYKQGGATIHLSGDETDIKGSMIKLNS